MKTDMYLKFIMRMLLFIIKLELMQVVIVGKIDLEEDYKSLLEDFEIMN